MGILYLVSTPIGNLDDISARAIKTLAEVKIIAAEDTRQTRKLLSHYHINASITSYHEHNKVEKIPYLLKELENSDIAVVSDAGTPALNDPGYELVRAAIQAGYRVSPIPGACASIAALVASGLPSDKFFYLGYLPRKKKERQRLLQEFSELTSTLIALEVPHRLMATLADLAEALGDERQIAIARELTKIHEEIFRGSIEEAREYFSAQPPRGEFTLVISGYQAPSDRWREDHLRREIQNLLDSNCLPATISSQMAKKSGWSRREIYQIVIEMRNHP